MTQNREKKNKNQEPKSIPAKTGLPAETGRNGPKQSEIFPEVEQGGVPYRFAYQYKIFRPFRSERNGIYNIDKKGLNGSKSLFDIYKKIIIIIKIKKKKEKKSNMGCLATN